MPERTLAARLGAALASASLIVFGLGSTLVCATASVLLGWIGPRGRLVLAIARLWSRSLQLFAGVRVTAHFEAPLDPRQSYVYLANHQSYFDIPALLPAIPSQVRFAAKRSLFKIPIFGWSIAVGGFIPIDREDRSKAREAFQVAADRLKNGVSVLFFPEGTRSHDGRLLPFERGGFLIALKSGLPIVPVGVSGARAVMPRGKISVRPGPIEVHFGAPIDVLAYGIRGRSELMAETRRRIATLAGIADEPVV